jgi:phosphoribosylglycinamide formyltransferase-1
MEELHMADAPKYRPLIFISGGGSTMLRVLQATMAGGQLRGLVEPAGIISSTAEAGGLEKLAQFNEVRDERKQIPSAVLDPRFHKNSRGDLIEMMLSLAKSFGATGFIGCGYIRMFPEALIEMFPGFGHNQHPAPLYDGIGFGGRHFYGLVPHEAVVRYSGKIDRPFRSYAVVHEVTPEYDTGRLVHMSESVGVDLNWSPEELQQRILPLEHQMVIEALAKIARAYIDGRPVHTLLTPPKIYLNDAEEAAFNESKQEALGSLSKH